MDADDHLKVGALVSAILTIAAMQKTQVQPPANPIDQTIVTYRRIRELLTSSGGVWGGR
jgi:hypothetical protein